MWKNFGINIPLIEGIFWLNNQVIKAFDTEGNLCSLYRVTISDDLSISIKKHKDFNKHKDKQFEKWEDTINRYKERLVSLEAESKSLITKQREVYSEHEIYVLTSTGKDSSVVEYICKNTGIQYKIVFNNTSLDCSDTYKIVKRHPEWIKTNPQEGFYQWIRRINYIPNRFSRGCCSVFKEGNHIEYFKNVQKAIWLMGVRNEESAKRSDYEDIGKNPKWGDKDWIKLLPIRKWTDLDIWLYILWKGIEINLKYKKGYPRVGCAIACPYYTKTTWVLDKYWYPKMYKRWHKILDQDFIDNQRWCQLNCTKFEYHTCWNGGLLREEPTDKVLHEMMEYKNIDNDNVARQYFNKTCYKCEERGKSKNIRQKDVIAMNMKYYGRNINKFACKKCLMEELNLSKDEWNQKILDFKNQGCVLF